MLLFSFYTPWKYQKIRGFWCFQEAQKRNLAWNGVPENKWLQLTLKFLKKAFGLDHHNIFLCAIKRTKMNIASSLSIMVSIELSEEILMGG